MEKKKASYWIQHVKKVAQREGLSYKGTLKVASPPTPPPSPVRNILRGIEDEDVIEEAVTDENDDLIDLEQGDILETEEGTLERNERFAPADIPERIEQALIEYYYDGEYTVARDQLRDLIK